MSKWDGPLGTLMLPSNTGGTNWPGGALDPETNILYIYSFTNVVSLGLINDAVAIRHGLRPRARARSERAGARGRGGAGGGGGGGEGGGAAVTVQGLPLIKPPYGRITAIDLDKGDDRLAGRARRHAGQRPQSSGARRVWTSRAPAAPTAASARW